MSFAPEIRSVVPAARLRGRLRPPGDKSITHRALLLAGLAAGRSRLEDASDGLDPNSTAACLRALGISVDKRVDKDGLAAWTVGSPGVEGWRAPLGPLDCGNSGTTLRLLAGILAGTPLATVLDGDASLRRRPLARVIEPLRAMGATLHAAADDTLPPLSVTGRRPLRPIDHATRSPSAQVKSAVLLAGLAAEGTTTVRESIATRDHTERMLRARGVAVTSEAAGPDGRVVVGVAGGQTVRPMDERIPGDISAAAFWLVAGAAHPDAQLVLERVGVNPTRRRALDLLRAMGADIVERPLPGVAGDEPLADLEVRSSNLRAIEMGPGDVAAAIDEVPALCVAAACARGTTRIRGAGELRHKESDRLAGIAAGLAALGARIDISGDDLLIEGGAGRPFFGLRAGEARSHDDHRLAMTFAVVGLIAGGPVSFDGAASVAVSYPSFFSDLEGACT